MRRAAGSAQEAGRRDLVMVMERTHALVFQRKGSLHDADPATCRFCEAVAARLRERDVQERAGEAAQAA